MIELMVWTGLSCIVAAVVLCGFAVVAFKVMFSPVRAVVAPCAIADVPGLTHSPSQSAVESLGFGVFELGGARALLWSFETLGFQKSGAVVIRNPPLPDMFVVLLTRPDADARLWVDPEGTPGTAAVTSATETVRVVTSGASEATSQHDKEDVEALPDGSPAALVHRHEQRMAGRTAREHAPDEAVQRYVDEWKDDLAAMKRSSLFARAIGWFSARAST